MGNKAIDKDYLLRQLKNFDDDVLEDKYQGKVEEMTQAEYDDLSAEEKNDGTIRFITDKNIIVLNNIEYGGSGSSDDLGLLVKNGKLCVRYAVEE